MRSAGRRQSASARPRGSGDRDGRGLVDSLPGQTPLWTPESSLSPLAPPPGGSGARFRRFPPEVPAESQPPAAGRAYERKPCDHTSREDRQPDRAEGQRQRRRVRGHRLGLRRGRPRRGPGDARSVRQEPRRMEGERCPNPVHLESRSSQPSRLHRQGPRGEGGRSGPVGPGPARPAQAVRSAGLRPPGRSPGEGVLLRLRDPRRRAEGRRVRAQGAEARRGRPHPCRA